MRRFVIFLYFLVLTTLALRQGNVYAIFFAVAGFLVLYFWAETLDKEDNYDLVASKHTR